MTDIKRLFEDRDETYKQQTDAIIAELSNVMAAANVFVESQEGPNGKLDWRDVQYAEDEEYLTMIGVLEYELGALVMMPNGNAIEINENTQEHFKRLIRLGIPFELATTGSQDEIVEFLVKSAEPDDVDEDLELLQLPVSDVDNTQFDLDALTKEQREQLKLFAMAPGDDD